jgi:hypothetical protein
MANPIIQNKNLPLKEAFASERARRGREVLGDEIKDIVIEHGGPSQVIRLDPGDVIIIPSSITEGLPPVPSAQAQPV